MNTPPFSKCCRKEGIGLRGMRGKWRTVGSGGGGEAEELTGYGRRATSLAHPASLTSPAHQQEHVLLHTAFVLYSCTTCRAFLPPVILIKILFKILAPLPRLTRLLLPVHASLVPFPPSVPSRPGYSKRAIRSLPPPLLCTTQLPTFLDYNACPHRQATPRAIRSSLTPTSRRSGPYSC